MCPIAVIQNMAAFQNILLFDFYLIDLDILKFYFSFFVVNFNRFYP